MVRTTSWGHTPSKRRLDAAAGATNQPGSSGLTVRSASPPPAPLMHQGMTGSNSARTMLQEIMHSPGGAPRPVRDEESLSHKLAKPFRKPLKMLFESRLCNLPIVVLRPDSSFKVAWDLFAVSILLYTIVVAPLRVAFEIEDFCPAPIWLWETVVDIAFIIDLLLNFVTATYTTLASGVKLTFSFRIVATQYLKSWFLIDLASSVPIDMILSLSMHGCVGRTADEAAAILADDPSGGTKLIRLVRVLRLVKLFKILRVLKLQNRLSDLSDRFPSTDDAARALPYRRLRVP